MQSSSKKITEEYFPISRSLLGSGPWDQVIDLCPDDAGPEALPETLRLQGANLGLPEFLSELAWLEWNLHLVASKEIKRQPGIGRIEVNPSLQVIQVPWKGLAEILKSTKNSSPSFPPSPCPLRPVDKSRNDCVGTTAVPARTDTRPRATTPHYETGSLISFLYPQSRHGGISLRHGWE